MMRVCTVLIAAALLLPACSDVTPDKPDDALYNPVLVRVGSDVITQQELALAINDSLGQFAALHLGTEGERKVLESLVMRKLMSKSQLAVLDEDARAQLELQVTAYREELLTKQYIQQQLVPEPVSDAMVAEYYYAYPHEFGAQQYASYQLVRADAGQGEQRQRVMWYLEQLTPGADWQALADRARAEEIVLHLVSGISSESGLLPEYQALINPLPQGGISAVADFNGRLIRVRVTERVSIPARPLAEVSDDIRRKLAPVQLKKAIMQATDNLKAHTDVEFYPLP